MYDFSYNVRNVGDKPTLEEVRLIPYSEQRVHALVAQTANANVGFDFKQFYSLLQTKYIAQNFIYKSSVSSTMDVVKEMQMDAPHGLLVLADVQTAGKGRAGRPWSSKSGKNLYFSILMKLSDVKESMKLNLAIPLSVVLTCETLGIKGAGIKWPNDVWVKGQKLSGMLVDVTWMGSNIFANGGVGINVNEDMSQNAEVSSVATSIFNILGAETPREKLLSDFCSHLEKTMTTSFEDVLSIYKTRDLLVGNEIIILAKKDSEKPERKARAVGYSPEGYLMVQYEGESAPQSLIAEEVTIRPKSMN